MREHVITVREKGTDLQCMICNEHQSILDELEMNGFLYDIDGETVHAIKLNDAGKIVESIAIKLKISVFKK